MISPKKNVFSFPLLKLFEQPNIIIIIVVIIIIIIIPGLALVFSETDQEALEQATGRVLRLRIEGPCTEGYC